MSRTKDHRHHDRRPAAGSARGVLWLLSAALVAALLVPPTGAQDQARDDEPPPVGVTVRSVATRGDGALAGRPVKLSATVLPGELRSWVPVPADDDGAADPADDEGAAGGGQPGALLLLVEAWGGSRRENRERPPHLFRLRPASGELEELPLALPAGASTLHLLRPGPGPETGDGPPAAARDLLLLGAPGKLYSLGSPAAPTAPSLLVARGGLDLAARPLQQLRPLPDDDTSAGGATPTYRTTSPLLLAGVGRVTRYRVGDGGEGGGGGGTAPKLERHGSVALPVEAARQRRGLTLTSPPVTLLQRPPGGTGGALLAVGPENLDNRRLRTLLIDTESGAETVAWSRLPGPEEVASSWYLMLAGRPHLLVTTFEAERLGVFEEAQLRLFPLAADRTRGGVPPSFIADTESKRWQPVDPTLVDLDGDGHLELVVIQPEGLAGKELEVEVYAGRGGGRFGDRAKRGEVDVMALAWRFGPDLLGEESLGPDGRPDLVALGPGFFALVPGVDARRRLLARDPALIVPLTDDGGSFSFVVDGRGDLDDADRPLTAPLGRCPELIDLDRDGRPEIVCAAAREQGRGRVWWARLP